MKKNFSNGTIIGVIIGLGIGVASPIIGATDIIIKSKPQPKKVNVTQIETKEEPVSESQEVVAVLQEINENIKKNAEIEQKQNERLIKGIETLIQRTGFNGGN